MNKFLLPLAFLLPCVLCAAPAVKLPSGDFSCSVTAIPRATKPESPEPPPPKKPGGGTPRVLKKLDVVRVGNIRRDTVGWSDGSTSVVWGLVNEKLLVTERTSLSGKKRVQVFAGVFRDTVEPLLLRFDQESISWISDEYLVSKGDPDGSLLHYKREIPQQVQPGEKPWSEVFQAWIDPKSRMPVKFDDGRATYILKFSADPPRESLAIPGNLQSELNRWKDAFQPHAHL